MIGKVKGETLNRIWRTFRTRGHVERIGSELPTDLVDDLNRGRVLTAEWYPIDSYLTLYGTLRRRMGHDEVVATAYESVLSGLRLGTWIGFVASLRGAVGEAFCQRAARRFGAVYKTTFTPGETTVVVRDGGAEILVSDTPWSADAAWRDGVMGGVLTIPTLASMAGHCDVSDAEAGSVRFDVRWTRRVQPTASRR